MASTSKSKDGSFYEGRAIEHFSDDRLGRQAFARFFADAISNYEGRESLILAINGPWGDGKTSFKNMVVDLLGQEHSEKIVTLHFTPWEWASQNQLASAFFTEIAKQLEFKDKSAAAKNAAGRLKALGRGLRLSKVVVPAIAPFAEMLLPGSTFLGVAAGKGLEKAEKFIAQTVEDIEEASKDEAKSLAEVKQELRLALTEYVETQKKLILVIIDDIDRLEPEEIRLLLQMVRANGDFPGLVYLLLYETEFVLKALEKLYPGSQQKFLEKIIQFQVDLPVPPENKIRDNMLERLGKIFCQRPSYLSLCDEGRFIQMWDSGLQHFITNLRQSERLLSSLTFHIGAFKSEEAEVNPLDLLVLECFRLNDPGVYSAIKASSDNLLPVWDLTLHFSIREEGADPWGKLLDDIAAESKTENRDSARKLLSLLFPDRSAGLNQFGPDKRTSERAGQRRICHVLYFDRYFRLTVDAEDIADAKIAELERNFGAPTEFVKMLNSLGAEGKLTLALTKLLARPQLKPSTKPAEFITALLDWAEDKESISGPSHHIRVSSAVHELIELQIPSTIPSEVRSKYFPKALEDRHLSMSRERRCAAKILKKECILSPGRGIRIKWISPFKESASLN